MINLTSCALFVHMTEAEIDECIKCSKAQSKKYDKNEIIFSQMDKPEYLYVLLEGSVSVCRDSVSGKRGIATAFTQSGEIFGEVYLFLPKEDYDYYTVATQNTVVLEIPKSFFYQQCANGCDYHTKLIRNMLGILAQKAYYLNQKLQLLSSGSLRQKIVKFLLDNVSENKVVAMGMNREEFADFLNVARPSLSRELIKMKDEGLINLGEKVIEIHDLGVLENIL